MGEAIGAVLGNAVGVAISPVPVIALVLILFSSSARANGLVFLTGWLVGLAVVATVVLAAGVESGSGSPTVVGGVLKVLIGGSFLCLTVVQWRKRPGHDGAAAMPAWMASIDTIGVAKAFGFGLLMSAVNPKNLGLTVAAAASISAHELGIAGTVTATAVFVVIGSFGTIAPLACYLIAGSRAQPLLNTVREWLVANNATVMTVLFAVLGAKVLGDGLGVLFGGMP